MIVDLLRNDLSRISERGTVRTSGLFEVQTYETLHQMVSTVSGKIDADMPLSKVLKEIYPCGSITGAPKVRTMEIINEVEREPRGIYTGAIGYISPDKTICLNVPIRTLVLWPDGTGEMGVGSGVVHDSDADAEYEECCLKGTFFTRGFADFHLIESLLFDGGYPLLERHLRRLAQSAQELGFRLNPQSLKEDLLARAATLQGRHKVRVMLEKSGEHRIECMSIESADDQPKRIIISSEAVHSKSWSLRHKLSQRTRYQKAHEFYSRLGYYDVVFFNEDNEITEGSFNNIFIRKGERWYTPPIECGLLPGVQRQWLLDSVQVDATEKRLVVDDLYRADEIFLTNAVRGVVKVELATTPNETSCSA
jgi:para-aminobenzoate synthetase/4-amino-4-deoxychorismate lyase